MVSKSQDDVHNAISSCKLFTDLNCTICKKLLCDAYETYCGCLYCGECIIKYLSTEKRHCCGNKDECMDEYLVIDKNVFKSAVINRKILKAKFMCPIESCTHTSELTQMEEHIRVCPNQSIDCPYLPIGCDFEKVTKDSVVSHLHNQTLEHTQLLIDLIENLRNEVSVLKDNFEKSQTEILSLRDNVKFLTEDSAREMAELKRVIERIKLDNGRKENRIATLEEELLGEENISATLNQDRLQCLEMEFKRNEEEISCIRRLFNKLDSTIETLNLGTNRMVGVGQTLFSVERLTARRATKDDLYSPYFYSHTNGYKLRLHVYPGGNGSGSGTHLSVFMHICNGEYNHILPWPCKHSFEISIVNQRNGESHGNRMFSYDTDPDNAKQFYLKPTGKDNQGCGFVKFISNTNLQSVNGLVNNDSIVIKCIARPPK